MTYPFYIIARSELLTFLGSPQGVSVRHIVSLTNAGDEIPECLQDNPHVLRFNFDDVVDKKDGVPCKEEDIARLIEFAGKVKGPVLFHCVAGVSRSTAAAVIVRTAQLGYGSEDKAIEYIYSIQPNAWPNGLMISHADRLLNRNGRLIVALEKIKSRELKKWKNGIL